MKQMALRVKLLAFFFVAVFFLLFSEGLARVSARRIGADTAEKTATTSYLPIYQSDLTIEEATEGTRLFSISLAFENEQDQELPQSDGYGIYQTTNIELKTDDDDLLDLTRIRANGSKKQFQLQIANKDPQSGCVTCAAASPTEIIIPDGTRFDKAETITDSEYAGIEFVGNITFVKDDDGWKMAEWVEILKTENGVTEKTCALSDSVYTFPTPAETEGKTFLGWKVGEELYFAQETISLSEYVGESIEIEAAYADFSLGRGAAIRYDKDVSSSGIRFSCGLALSSFKEYEDILCGAGIIVMPSDMIGEAAFTLQNYNGTNQAKDFYTDISETDFQSDDVFHLRATVSKVLESNYNRAFSARAYLVIERNGEREYVWEPYVCERSVYQVATLALEENETANELSATQKTILNDYVNEVANIVNDGESAIDENGYITVVLTTERKSVSALTYNGKRVKKFTQSYADGKLTFTFAETDMAA